MMVSDLKIEIFAYRLFHRLWHEMELIEAEPDVLEIYGDECARDKSYIEACDDLIIKAAFCRSELFIEIYMPYAPIEEMKNAKSLSEMYDHINRLCDREDLFGHLTVFERMLASSDLVANICFLIRKKTERFGDILNYGHTFWSMYFDKFTEEFYENGGWNKLKKAAKSYVSLNSLLDIFGFEENPFDLKSSKEALVNYSNFKKAVQFYTCSKHSRGHISKLWIKFCIQNFYSYIRIPSIYEYSTDAYEADILLKDLKILCDPSSYCEVCCVETMRTNHQESSILVETLNTFEHIYGVIDVVCNNFSNFTKHFEKQFESKSVISSLKEVDFGIKDENIEMNKKILSEKEMSQGNTSDLELVEVLINKHNSLPFASKNTFIKASQSFTIIEDSSYVRSSNINENSVIKLKELYSKSVERQSEVLAFDELFTTNQTIESNINYYPRHIGSGNESVNTHSENKIESISEMVEMNSFLKNECQSETIKPMNISHIRQIAKLQRDGTATKDDLPTFKELSNKKQRSTTYFEMKDSNKKVKESFDFNNSIEQTEIYKAMNGVSISQMTVSKVGERTITDVLSMPNQFHSVHPFIYTSDKAKRIKKARLDLRNEQDDPEIKKVLNFILILGDKQGTRYAIQSKDNSSISLPEKLKRKKHGKNKKYRN